MLVLIAALNLWASWRVFSDDLSSWPQRWGQFAFVWLVPGLGALIALQLKRKEPERGSGSYPEMPAEVDDAWALSRGERRAHGDSGESSSHGESAPDQ